jgi:hypothetical protein
MGWKDVAMRLRALVSRRRVESELDEELSFHLAMEAEKNRARGLAGAESDLQARREFGGMAHFREECRDARGLTALENLVRDVRYGIRVLRRTPVFTAVAIASLAIGIGANTAVFSLVDTVLLRSLPVRNAEELVVLGWSANNAPRISTTYSNSSGGGAYGRWHTNVFSWPMFESARQSGALAETIGYSQLPRLNVLVNGESRITGGMAVSGNYFTGLGVRMALGRPLVADDDSEGGTTAAVISYRLWERAFGLDPAAAGKTIYINRKPYVVVGVTAREFFGVSVTGLFLAPEIDVTLPIQMKERIDGAPDRGNEWRSVELCWVQMMGRLKPGSGAGAAASQLGPLLLANLPETAADELRGQAPRGGCAAGQSRSGVRAYAVQGSAEGAGRGGGPRAADGVRQPGGPAAGAGGGAAQGDHHSAGDGRGTVAADSSTVDGERAALGGRRGGRTAGGSVGLAGPARDGAGRAVCAAGGHTSGSAGAGLRGGGVDADDGAIRFGAGAARDARGPGARAEGRLRTMKGHPGGAQILVALQIAAALLLTVGATLAVRSLANLRAIPLGFNATRVVTFRAGRGPQRLRGSAQHGALLAAAGTVEPHARRSGGQWIHRDADERTQLEYHDFGGWD